MSIFIRNMEALEGYEKFDVDTIKETLSQVFIGSECDVKILYINIMTDVGLKEINKKLFKRDYLTDTISINLSEQSDMIDGEIYISIERVRENAMEYGCSFNSEFFRVLIHSALHLCGFQDDTQEGKMEMKEREDYYLSNISFT